MRIFYCLLQLVDDTSGNDGQVFKTKDIGQELLMEQLSFLSGDFIDLVDPKME